MPVELIKGRPTPWWKAALWLLYPLGYFGYLLAVGTSSWDRLPFGQWVAYMTFQLLYALIWPAWLVL